MTVFAQPKRHPVRDAAYRQFVRQHPCALFSSAECRGPIVCMHLTPPGQASRGQKYSDVACAPGCRVHHDVIDGRLRINPHLRDALLVIVWSKALEIRESWHRRNA